MKKLNILFLFPDQHRGDWLPYNKKTLEKMGITSLPLRMPNVRKMMDSGFTFTKTVSSSPVCAPARACLASGLRYDKCRVPDNNVDYPLDQRTFYSVLKENGYSVGGVGKFDLHKPTRWWGLDGWIDSLGKLGFTHAVDNAGKMDAVSSSKDGPKDPYMKFLHDNNLAELHRQDIRSRGKYTADPTPLPEYAYCDNWLTDNGVRMIREFPKDKPWFLQVNFTGPHGPWDVTKRMREKWKNIDFEPPNGWGDKDLKQINGVRQNYAAMLENIDRNIGVLIDEVEKRGELGNTLIIYSADHGEMLGDFSQIGKCEPERGSVHIPLVIMGPGIKQTVVSNALVELQDLAATILDYAGTGMKEAADSISLKSLVEGKIKHHRDYQYSALKAENKHSKTITDWKMIADKQYKLIIHGDGTIRLYDLDTDPWENKNIADNNPHIVQRLRSLY